MHAYDIRPVHPRPAARSRDPTASRTRPAGGRQAPQRMSHRGVPAPGRNEGVSIAPSPRASAKTVALAGSRDAGARVSASGADHRLSFVPTAQQVRSQGSGVAAQASQFRPVQMTVKNRIDRGSRGPGMGACRSTARSDAAVRLGGHPLPFVIAAVLPAVGLVLAIWPPEAPVRKPTDSAMDDAGATKLSNGGP